MKLKLYVWDNFAIAWSSPGLAFAIAESEAAAKDAIEAETGGVYRPVGAAKAHNTNQHVVYAVAGCD